MIESMKLWWRNHGTGERWLMAVLGVAILIVFLWLGIWRPVEGGLEAGWARQGTALDRLASVRAKVEALKHLPGPAATGGVRPPIEQFVSQMVGEAGFTLDQASPQGSGRMSINIGSARMGPLLAWLSKLEQAGISVQTISIVPGATEGTVAVQALLQEATP